jgi:hypothetical protein
MFVSASIIGVIYLAMIALKAGTQPPEVVFPAWCYKNNDPSNKTLSVNLPMKLGEWTGQIVDLDEKRFVKTDASIADNREYIDESGHRISVHIAYFADVEAGVWHDPTNCYRCAGWHLKEESKVPMDGRSSRESDDSEVYLTRWEKEQSPSCLVAHWYYLDGRIFYGRDGLMKARWEMRGRESWPPMVKILLQTTGTSQADQEAVLQFSKQVHLWLDQQSKSVKEPASAAEKPAAAKAKEPAKKE